MPRSLRSQRTIKMGQRPANAISAGRWFQPARRPELSAELTVNGGFDTDTVWLKGVGWTIAGGVAAGAAGTLSKLDQTQSALVNTATYRVTFTLVTRTAGGVFISVAGVDGALRTTPATYTEDIISTGGDTLGITKDAAFAGSIDDMSVRRVLNP